MLDEAFDNIRLINAVSLPITGRHNCFEQLTLDTIIDCLVVEVEPASLTSYLYNIITESLHLIISGSYHLTIHIADRIDDYM